MIPVERSVMPMPVHDAERTLRHTFDGPAREPFRFFRRFDHTSPAAAAGIV